MGAGKEKEARTQAAKVLEIKPDFTVDWYEKSAIFSDRPERRRFSDNLRKAGLPE